MIHHGDLFDVLPTLEADSIDACVTDPPYGLEFMGKEWDKLGGEVVRDPASVGGFQDGKGGNPYSRSRIRFGAKAVSMQEWHERWAREVYRVLKPGAHMLVFGAPRTSHRMICGIEDAGFEIRDSLCWLFGSGFPKSLDVSKAIDKAAGAERETVGVYESPEGTSGASNHAERIGTSTRIGGLNTITAPATEAAKRWSGWGTALKPAYEPIVLARKPLIGTVAQNVLQHGTGAINVDACRIKTTTRDDYGRSAANANGTINAHQGFEGKSFAIAERAGEYASPLGRWPANVLLDEQAAAMLDCEVGDCRSAGDYPSDRVSEGIFGRREQGGLYADAGGPSRYFYTAKPSRAERDHGIYDLPETSGGEATDRADGSAGIESPRAGAGRTGGARNAHPTVKPVELMRWLVKLITPPDGTVLDPFCGSGTTGMACAYEFREFIGIERESEYVEIAKRRIASCVPLFTETEHA